MRRSLIFILLFEVPCTLLSQVDSARISQEYMEQADQIYRQQKEAIEIAKELYIQAANADVTNLKANWMAGKLYLETINKDAAVTYLLRVKEQKPNYRFDLDYYIGRAYHYGLDFDKALSYYERYKKKVMSARSYRGKDRVPPTRVSRRIMECNNGKEIITRPAQYSMQALGENINSVWPDYAPVLNKDENVMIFTSRRQEDNTSPNVDRDNFYFEDVFISHKVNGEWQKAKNIGPPINTAYHDSNIALSADGKRLYLYKDENNGDIYYSDFDGEKWSKPKYLTNKINSSVYSENSLTETLNSDVVFYTSNRPGGEGGSDIYMCIKDNKGKWYKSKSLGPVINTKYDEDSPFLAYDGKTLYFSSSGHKGYGGFDIFKSVYDSTTQSWSEPENLGYPVNTPDNEIYFHASKDQRTGYFASVREGGVGFTDIFMVKYHGSGNVPAELIAANNQRVNTQSDDPQQPPKAQAGKQSEATQTTFEDYELKIMDHVHKIFFNTDQSSIKDEHQAELDSIIQLLNKYDVLHIDIAGYASKDGNPRYNLQLSQKRALIVLDYLIGHGLNEDRVVARGYGSITDEEGDPEGHRRADVKIVGRTEEN
ncbi:OmpA family protein [Fulvivirga sp. M361]|uniref:OmpA family protein n=1 Tax=Fulvivirga sp. M361 TaxID=2594266 RepID=UPI0011799397|nr:OmpA family protein [Fulvivirga sp. M361]TRX51862.1 OmpA family protein [Fulvivirga sp. M361]